MLKIPLNAANSGLRISLSPRVPGHFGLFLAHAAARHIGDHQIELLAESLGIDPVDQNELADTGQNAREKRHLQYEKQAPPVGKPVAARIGGHTPGVK